MDKRVSGRYRLIEPIGEGGMGVVWRAYDEVLDRTVAIKEVRYTGVDEARRAELNRRTIREARAAGRLDHPSVVVVHDVVEEDGRPWIVMQLVRSRSLAQVVRESGPLRAGQVAVIGDRVLDALRAAHATGVLHRDVKPENVLLADDGRVVLTDFGIASMETETGLTATGGLVGTPAYMPPERLNGEPARPESDLWSLGATLYTAVEGRPPYKGDSWAATVAAVLRDEPRPPVHAGALTPVIMGLLHRSPAGRMPADQAARLLREIASSPGPAASPRPSPGDRLVPEPRDDRSVPGTFPGHGRTPQDTFPGDEPPVAFRGGGPPGVETPSAGAVTVTGRRRAKALWIGLPAVLAVAAAVGTAGVLLSERRTTSTASGDPTDTTTVSAGPTDTVSAGPTDTTPASNGPTTPGPAPTQEPSGAVVPEGWRPYANTAGRFRLAVPKGWRAKKNPARDSVSLQGPGTPGTLLVEWTVPDIPWQDPVRHWIGLEREIRAKGEFRQYTRLGITPTDYLGVRAADWEFTRLREGVLIHVINRGFHTPDGRPYAIYWETPQSRWKQDRHYFETFTKTFRPQ
ncbi:protein kinase [Nonomuraea terrae]|uniref:serine/threonine-protein kinase n=1 Tax=Nonomuraea terrae TaxID=2530383 RepID=UPI00379E804C